MDSLVKLAWQSVGPLLKRLCLAVLAFHVRHPSHFWCQFTVDQIDLHGTIQSLAWTVRSKKRHETDDESRPDQHIETEDELAHDTVEVKRNKHLSLSPSLRVLRGVQRHKSVWSAFYGVVRVAWYEVQFWSWRRMLRIPGAEARVGDMFFDASCSMMFLIVSFQYLPFAIILECQENIIINILKHPRAKLWFEILILIW